MMNDSEYETVPVTVQVFTPDEQHKMLVVSQSPPIFVWLDEKAAQRLRVALMFGRDWVTGGTVMALALIGAWSCVYWLWQIVR